MTTPGEYVNNRDYSRILGIPLDGGEKSRESLKVTSDTTAWDIYNYHAGRAESEVVKDWKDTLNTLLVFAGLYSGVLTAFITESIKLLQEDSTNDTRDILLHISRQLATPSTAAFNATSNPFVAPEWALQVNYCFFVSLSCALITALAAVVALQWVGSYDRGLNPSSVESRALQQQFRMEGAKRWKMEEIVGALPTLIFISLLLFFVGLAEWLWYIHHNVAIIVIVGASLGALFYAFTTLVSMVSVVAPFRTPASRYLPLWFGLALQSITLLFQDHLPRVLSLIFGPISTFSQPKPTMTVPAAVTHIGADVTLSVEMVSRVQETIDEMPRRPLGSRWGRWLRRISKPFAPLYSIEPLEVREQKAVRKSENIKRSSLFWLARSISIEPYHRQMLMIIMQAILDQPEWQLHSDHDNAGLWKLIFTELRVPYTHKRNWVDYSSEDLKNSALFVRGLSSIGQGFLKNNEFQSMVWSFYGSYHGFGAMCRIMKKWKEWGLELASLKPDLENLEHEVGDELVNEDDENSIRTWEEGTDRPIHTTIRFQPGETNGTGGRPLERGRQIRRDTILKNLEDVLGASGDFPLEFVVATLQQVKQSRSELVLIATQELFDLITRHLHIERNHNTNTTPLPFPVLDIVQELIISRLSGTAVASFDAFTYSEILKKYLDVTQTGQADLGHEKAISAHETLIEQTIANLARINASKLSNGPRVQEVLIKLDQLAQAPFRIGTDPVIFALLSMLNTGIDMWSQSNRVYTTKAMSSLLRIEDSGFNGENWIVWWMEILPAFGKFIDEDDTDTESIVIQHSKRALSAHLSHRGQFTDAQIATLSKISHIGVRLLATTVTQSPVVARSLLLNDSEQKDKPIWTPSSAWTQFFDVCFDQLGEQASQNETILRAFAVGSSAELFDRIYELNISPRLKSPPELFKYLSLPVLPALFRHSSEDVERTMMLLETVCVQEGFSTEFYKAGGFNWLPTLISKYPYYFEEALSVIRQALSKCHTNNMCLAWINATLECQAKAREAISKGDATALRLWGYIATNAGLLTKDLKQRKKTGMGMGTGKQAVHIAVASNIQERPAAADALRVVPEIAKKGDMNIIDDDGKSKLDTAPAKEWTIEEKEIWEQLVNTAITGFEDISTMVQAPSSYSEASMLPRKDVSLLRKFTLNGSDSVYEFILSILDDTLESVDLSQEYFRDPVLGKILRMDSESIRTIMRTLVPVSEYAWFASEFTIADGPRLLPLRIEPLYLEEVADIVTKALSVSQTYKDIHQWLSLAYYCLWSVGIALQGSTSQRARMLAYAEEPLDELSSLITLLSQKWHHDRQYRSIWTPETGETPTKEVLKCDAGIWSSNEWEIIEQLTQELVSGGLQRGYIMPAPSAESGRFSRDPDGLCSYSRPQRIHTLSSRIIAMTFPRDPEGICPS